VTVAVRGDRGVGVTARSAPVKIWTDVELEGLRAVGDEAADTAVRKHLQRTGSSPRQLMGQIAMRERLARADRSPELEDFLEAPHEVPPFFDKDKVAAGQDLFARYGPEIGASLFCVSLPSGYAGRRGVQVLYRSGWLLTNPKRRVLETAQMIVRVMTPNAFAKRGAGYRTVRQVRLMHAAVRHLVVNDAPGRRGRDNDYQAEWPPGEVPVNQEDLLGTVFTFALCPLEALARAGVFVSDEEADAYLHVWNVVGALLGIDPDHLPQHHAEATVLFDRIRSRQYGACPEGQAMTSALIELMEELLPTRLFDGLPATAVRYFVGDDVADLLGVPPGDWTRAIFVPARLLHMGLSSAERHEVVMAKAAQWFGRAIWEGIVARERDYARPTFELPASMAERWNITRPPQSVIDLTTP